MLETMGYQFIARLNAHSMICYCIKCDKDGKLVLLITLLFLYTYVFHCKYTMFFNCKRLDTSLII